MEHIPAIYILTGMAFWLWVLHHSNGVWSRYQGSFALAFIVVLIGIIVWPLALLRAIQVAGR